MSAKAMHKLVGHAVVSERFCAGLLNGRRSELLERFDFAPDEVDSLMSIEASDLPAFAAAVERLVSTSVPTTAVPKWVPSQIPPVWALVDRTTVRPL
jgi:hypothetical protein